MTTSSMTPGERPTDGPQFGDGLSRGAPSGAGVDADAVIAFLDEVEARGLELHSFMLYRAGRVVAEAWWWPFGPERPRIMHSLAKSLTSCAIGLAIADGALSLDDKVIGFFPEHLPARVDANLAAMTVEDLLTMRTGHASEVGGSLWRGIDASWIDEFFKIPVVHPPGATYVYSSAASYMLAAILHRATGKTLHQYLRPRLFEPLSIRGETWDVGPDGINPGGNGFTGKTSDVLKLGALMAQGGVWEGRQLLPRAWVELATRSHANNGRYGYHWVTYENGAYAAVGMFVQMVMVFPDQGATLALTGAIESSENVLPVIFEHFPKAFRAAPFRATGADARLKARLASIAGERRLHAAGVDGDWSRAAHSFAVEPNPLGVIELRFEITADACVFHITDAEGRHSVACGRETWIEGQTDVPGRELHHGYRLRGATVVARARWLDATTLEMVWIFADTAFRDTVTCRFAQGRVSVDREVNINSAARRHPTLVGRLA